MQFEDLIPIKDSLNRIADQLLQLNATFKSIDESLDSIQLEMSDFDSIRRGLVGIRLTLDEIRG